LLLFVSERRRTISAPTTAARPSAPAPPSVLQPQPVFFFTGFSPGVVDGGVPVAGVVAGPAPPAA